MMIKKEKAKCFDCGSTNLEIITGIEGSNCLDCLEKSERDEAIKMHSRAGLALMGIFWAAYLWSVYL